MPEETLQQPPVFQILPARYREIVNGLTLAQQEQLRPLVTDIATIDTFINTTLDALHIKHKDIQAALHMEIGEALSANKNREFQVAAQIFHIEQVNRATLALKTELIKRDLPPRTVAIQLGTGFEPPP